MKPSPHQDAADLVARLDLTDARKCPFDGDNNLLPSDPCPICGDTGEFNSDPAPSKCISFSQQTVLDEAKAFIEQQAKALSEAEERCAKLVRDVICTIDWPPTDGDTLIDALQSAIRTGKVS